MSYLPLCVAARRLDAATARGLRAGPPAVAQAEILSPDNEGEGRRGERGGAGHAGGSRGRGRGGGGDGDGSWDGGGGGGGGVGGGGGGGAHVLLQGRNERGARDPLGGKGKGSKGGLPQGALGNRVGPPVGLCVYDEFEGKLRGLFTKRESDVRDGETDIPVHELVDGELFVHMKRSAVALKNSGDIVLSRPYQHLSCVHRFNSHEMAMSCAPK